MLAGIESDRLKSMSRTARGFTIVELLIVIVIIAILAAITIVAYNGIQARANDTRVREGAAQFERALLRWSIDHGNVLRGNSGSTVALSGDNCTDGGGSGFVGTGSYPCTTEDILAAKELLPQGYLAKLPKNPHYTSTDGRRSIMLYTCGSGTGVYALFWTLHQPTDSDTNNVSSALTQCGVSTNVRDTWGMRAAKIIRLQS